MWKPGTAAPPPPTNVSPKTPQNRKQNSSSSKIQSPKSSNSGTKTKLSGATMGMRFMQRKSIAAADAKRIKEEQNNAKAEQAEDEWTIHDKKETNETGKSMDVDEEKPSNGIPEVATTSDMYGISAEIIGRRSFGGFRKSVADTYDNAVQMIQYNRVSKKVEKQHISDDELLKRYEKYVKGHSSATVDVSKQKRDKRKREQR